MFSHFLAPPLYSLWPRNWSWGISSLNALWEETRGRFQTSVERVNTWGSCAEDLINTETLLPLHIWTTRLKYHTSTEHLAFLKYKLPHIIMFTMCKCLFLHSTELWWVLKSKMIKTISQWAIDGSNENSCAGNPANSICWHIPSCWTKIHLCVSN